MDKNNCKKCGIYIFNKKDILIHFIYLDKANVGLLAPPIIKLSISDSPKAIGESIVVAMNSNASPHPSQVPVYLDEIYKIVGIKGWRSFVKKTKYIEAKMQNEKIVFTYNIDGGSDLGFIEHDKIAETVINKPIDYTNVGNIFLNYYNHCVNIK